MELPAPCGNQPQDHWAEDQGFLASRRAGAVLYLFVEGDVVQPHTRLPREEVGAVLTVPQEAPAERGSRPGVEGVPGAAKAQSGAGSPQTLGAGVIVVQEAWARGNLSPSPGA